MTTYIFKTILCSAILILFYYLILEREKIYRFNRFYLLSSLVVVFIIPLITIKTRHPADAIPELVYQQIRSFQGTISPQILPSADINTPVNYVLIIYFAVILFLSSRFLINIYILFKKIRNNGFVPYNGAKLVLTADKHVPHSSHELAHISQRHSLDILFIELITIVAWINPLLYLYRKSIQLNHEFLADEFVVKTLSSPRLRLRLRLQPHSSLLTPHSLFLTRHS
jgi:bla regulator protein blaR1